MTAEKKISLSALLKKLALSMGIGWTLIMILQGILRLKQGVWISIPFGAYDIALSQILGWSTLFFMIAAWVIDHKPHAPEDTKNKDIPPQA